MPAEYSLESRCVTSGIGIEMAEDRVADQQDVRGEEDEEDRREDLHRLLHAAQVERDQKHDRRDFRGQLPVRQRLREKAEDGVAAAGDRHGDRQHVVDDQRAAGDEPHARPEELRGDDVAAAAARELLDDARVRRRQNQHRDRRRDRERQREVVVLAERAERLFGAVRGRGETVRAETDPGQERDERDLVERVRVADVAAFAENLPLHALRERLAREERVVVFFRSALNPDPPAARRLRERKSTRRR